MKRLDGRRVQIALGGAAAVALLAAGQIGLLPQAIGERAANNLGGTAAPTYQLTIVRSGPLTGQLSVQAAGPGAGLSAEPCAQAACVFTLPRGDYQIAASGDARVVSWGAACPDGQATCAVLVDRARTVEVRTERAPKTLTLKKLGDGMGDLLLSGPTGMTCGGTCLYDPPDDLIQTVTLRAEPAHAFAGWQGACTGSEPTCSVQIDRALEAVGTFR